MPSRCLAFSPRLRGVSSGRSSSQRVGSSSAAGFPHFEHRLEIAQREFAFLPPDVAAELARAAASEQQSGAWIAQLARRTRTAMNREPDPAAAFLIAYRSTLTPSSRVGT